MTLELTNPRFFMLGKNVDTPLAIGTDISLGNFMSNRELRIHDVNEISPTDILICVDSPLNRFEWDLLKSSRNLKILVRYEPSVVMPVLQSKKLLRLFTSVIDIGRPPNVSETNVKWPQNWQSQIPLHDDKRIDRFVLLNANKLSFVEGELYSLRRSVGATSEEIDLVGRGWDIKRWRKLQILLAELFICVKAGKTPQLKAARGWFRPAENWLGEASNKGAILSSYKYSIVIENSLEFLSEKLFDSFFFRAIPIYVGPPVEAFNIPKELVIQVEPNLLAVLRGIALARKINYSEWRQSCDTWLAESSTYNEWEANSIFNKIHQICETAMTK